MTPQLMEDGSEFLINEDEEGWIVSIDNSIVIFMSILSGVLQTKYGPMKVIDYVHFPLQFISNTIQSIFLMLLDLCI